MQLRIVALAVDKGPQIAERDWLTSGLLWIGVGMLALSPLSVLARAGRVLFTFILFVHTVEAVYVGFRARTAGLNAEKWFLKMMVLGSSALRKVESYLRKTPRRRSLR